MVLRQLDGSIVQALFAFLNMQHWLVTHLVNSTSNVTSRHRGPKRTRGWLQSGITTAHVLSMCQSILWRKLSFSSYSVGSCTFSVLCMYSTFRHHPHPLGYLCAKLCFYRAPPSDELAHGEKSRTHSLSHSPSLFDVRGTKALTLQNNNLHYGHNTSYQHVITDTLIVHFHCTLENINWANAAQYRLKTAATTVNELCRPNLKPLCHVKTSNLWSANPKSHDRNPDPNIKTPKKIKHCQPIYLWTNEAKLGVVVGFDLIFVKYLLHFIIHSVRSLYSLYILYCFKICKNHLRWRTTNSTTTSFKPPCTSTKWAIFSSTCETNEKQKWPTTCKKKSCAFEPKSSRISIVSCQTESPTLSNDFQHMLKSRFESQLRCGFAQLYKLVGHQNSQVLGLSLGWAPPHRGLRQATYTCVLEECTGTEITHIPTRLRRIYIHPHLSPCSFTPHPSPQNYHSIRTRPLKNLVPSPREPCNITFHTHGIPADSVGFLRSPSPCRSLLSASVTKQYKWYRPRRSDALWLGT